MKQEVLNILERQGLISSERKKLITESLDRKEDLDFILSKFQIPVDRIADVKSQVYNLPRFVGNDPERSVLSKLSSDSSTHYKMVFLGETETDISIGVLDPEISGLREAATFLSNASSKKPYSLFILSTTQFNDFLAISAGNKVNKVDSSEVSDSIQKGNGSLNGDESPVVILVRDMVGEAIKKGASDIHIEPDSNKLRVRYRIDGELLIVRELPITNHLAVMARIKILCNLKLDEKRRPQDGHFSIDYENRKIDFRVSTMPSYFGEKVVIRVLDTYRGVRGLDELDMNDQHLALIKEALSLPYGIILITGPTGSGKTSTLYSMLNALDHDAKNIVSLEDPVEYSLSGVNQSQIASDIGYTFASGLRSILRQDPDVIMVGEIRDEETAKLAVQAALTGHLVFSTIHTNTAISTLTRLIEMGVEPYLLAPTVRLVIGQRLVKKLVPESPDSPHELISIDGSYRQMVKQQFGDLSPETLSRLSFSPNFHSAKPSKENYSGTSGRVAVFEILKIDKEIEELILHKADENDIYKNARSKGMITLKEDALLKCMEGKVPFTEAMSL
jgi:type IV pilus assembly protein PilB